MQDEQKNSQIKNNPEITSASDAEDNRRDTIQLAFGQPQKNDQLLTVKEASRKLGKRTGSLRKAIQRGYVKAVKNDEGKWMIPADALDKIAEHVHDGTLETDDDNVYLALGQKDTDGLQSPVEGNVREIIQELISRHEQQQKDWQKERDQLRDGLMMYRFQFEELARRIKALPVPPELVAERLKKQEEELAKKQVLEAKLEKTKELEERLTREKSIRQSIEDEAAKLRQELEDEKNELDLTRTQLEKERKRAWWKKLLGIK